jgi:hypothetical protein
LSKANRERERERGMSVLTHIVQQRSVAEVDGLILRHDEEVHDAAALVVGGQGLGEVAVVAVGEPDVA